MDQIIKWATGIMMVAIASHLLIDHYLSPKLDQLSAENKASSTSRNYVADASDHASQQAVKTAHYDEEIEDPLPGRAVRLKAGNYGHFHLDAKVNGAKVHFLVDTGASYVSLNYKDARRAGIRVKKADFKHRVNTANGVKYVAVVNVDKIRYKNIWVRDVVAAVSEPGALNGSNLLGNSFLSKLREFKISNGTLIMRP